MRPANCTSIYAEPEVPEWQKELNELKAKKKLSCAAPHTDTRPSATTLPAQLPFATQTPTERARAVGRCKAKEDSPQIGQAWCETACNSDANDPGCKQYCECQEKADA